MDKKTLLEEWRREARAGPVGHEVRDEGQLFNFHGRVVPPQVTNVYERLSRMGTALDDLWPLASVPMKNEGALEISVQSGHGPIRYELAALEKNHRIEWRFTMANLSGRYEYLLEPVDSGTYVENVIDGSLSGELAESWPTTAGPLHGWIIERIFDRLEQPLAPFFDARYLRAIR